MGERRAIKGFIYIFLGFLLLCFIVSISDQYIELPKKILDLVSNTIVVAPIFGPMTLLISVLVALSLYKQNRDIAAQTTERHQKAETFNHIITQTRDRDVIEMFEEMRALRAYFREHPEPNPERSYEVVRNLEIELTDGKHKRAEDILKKVFNYYEATAIGLKNETLHEEMLEKWWRTTFILDWVDWKSYVEKMRTEESTPRAFIEFENLSKEWARSHRFNYLIKSYKQGNEALA